MGSRSPTMTAISSAHPTTKLQGGEDLLMAIHRIPTDEASPTPGAAGLASNHRTMALMPTAPVDAIHLPSPTMIGKEAAHPFTLYPFLHLTGRPNSSRHHREIKREATRIIPAWRYLKLPSMLEGNYPLLARPKPGDGRNSHTLSHRHESVIHALSMAPKSTGRRPTTAP